MHAVWSSFGVDLALGLQVVHQSLVEKHRILRYNTDMSSKRIDSDILYIVHIAPSTDCVRCRVMCALNLVNMETCDLSCHQKQIQYRSQISPEEKDDGDATARQGLDQAHYP